eukprot:Nk52_evm1s923 gene=Nk52_evmTU1s923
MDPSLWFPTYEMLAPSHNFKKERLIVGVILHCSRDVQEWIATTPYKYGGGTYKEFKKLFIKEYSSDTSSQRAAMEAEEFNPIGMTVKQSHMAFIKLVRKARSNLSHKRARKLLLKKTPARLIPSFESYKRRFKRHQKAKGKSTSMSLLQVMKVIANYEKRFTKGATIKKIEEAEISTDAIPETSLQKSRKKSSSQPSSKQGGGSNGSDRNNQASNNGSDRNNQGGSFNA